MSFSAGHYMRIAKVIREEISPFNSVSPGAVIGALAKMFKDDNPKFDTGMFWDECQPIEENKDGL